MRIPGEREGRSLSSLGLFTAGTNNYSERQARTTWVIIISRKDWICRLEERNLTWQGYRFPHTPNLQSYTFLHCENEQAYQLLARIFDWLNHFLAYRHGYTVLSRLPIPYIYSNNRVTFQLTCNKRSTFCQTFSAAATQTFAPNIFFSPVLSREPLSVLSESSLMTFCLVATKPKMLLSIICPFWFKASARATEREAYFHTFTPINFRGARDTNISVAAVDKRTYLLPKGRKMLWFIGS